MSVELPPEIHGEIVSHILPDEETSDRDCRAMLATLRLVSKSFHSFATPSLFETYKVESRIGPTCNLFLHDLCRKDVTALAFAPFVKHVVIENLAVGGKMLQIYSQAIQNMPNLIKLSLSQNMRPEDVEWLATLPMLQNLSLYRGQMDAFAGSTLQTLTTICRRSLKIYGPYYCNLHFDPVSRIITSGNVPLTTLDIVNLHDSETTGSSSVDMLESLPTIVNLTIARYVSRRRVLRKLSPNSLPNLRFLKCTPGMLPIFTGNHLERLRSLDLTGASKVLDSESTPRPKVTINPFLFILTSLEELTVPLPALLFFNPKSQTTFATNLPRLNTLIADGELYQVEPNDHDFDNRIDWLIASFSPPNDIRELRFHVLGKFPKVNLLREREMIAKIIEGPFPRLRKVAFSFHVTWVKESVMRVARAGESDTKERLDDWRPFIPRWLTSKSSPLLDQSVVDRVRDYVQVQMEAASGFTS